MGVTLIAYMKKNKHVDTRPLGGIGGPASRYDDISIVSDFRVRYRADRTSKKGATALLTPAAIRGFRKIIYGYFDKFGRDFPWRHTDDPYHILVSEIMLQQTRVGRVAEKYPQFIRAFPTLIDLAGSSLKNVLATWQGMGYNRRARYLLELARVLKKTRAGEIPDTPEELERLPGIGMATASSICAFAFNRATVFIETNIRAALIHFFFHSAKAVRDTDLVLIAEAVLDRKNPRRWYSALMDYGAMLKGRHPNPSRRSAHHRKQPPFEGSRRQARGMMLRALLAHPGISEGKLADLCKMSPDEAMPVVDELVRDGLIRKRGRLLYV
jgi:A/G-specific adenine glycosylase